MSSNVTLQAQFADNTLINGRMPFNCSLAARGSTCNSSDATYSKFRVRTGKTYKLRLINSGAGSIEYFSIDNHQLTIISNDFVDIIPYNTTIVTLGVSVSTIKVMTTSANTSKTGQRTDVLFTPRGNGSIWMRTQTSGKFCGGSRSVAPKARAIVLLDDYPEDTIPTTVGYSPPVDNGMCANVSVASNTYEREYC
jgi:FtsP/CotA-like multicopper oxidase with cupredoxin domain